MSDEILVNVSPTETRVAHVENGLVQEVFLERTRNRGLVSNIYKGKVVRVLPGMQAAFVDIGLERAGFIHASDFAPSLDLHLTTDENTAAKDIRELVREGQSLLVQVVKEPISTKGPRLTTQISISARNLVFMPNANHIGISARIEDEGERERLKELLQHAIDDYSEKNKGADQGEGKNNSGGFIVRTVAEGCVEEEISADIPFLIKLWDRLESSVKHKKAPAIIYEDLPLYKRTLRD